MKVKDETASCGGLTKEHGYLGHFTKPQYLNKGHNVELIPGVPKSILEDKNPTVTRRFEWPKEPTYEEKIRAESERQIINEFRMKGPDYKPVPKKKDPL